jgi:hypothetical protein
MTAVVVVLAIALALACVTLVFLLRSRRGSLKLELPLRQAARDQLIQSLGERRLSTDELLRISGERRPLFTSGPAAADLSLARVGYRVFLWLLLLVGLLLTTLVLFGWLTYPAGARVAGSSVAAADALEVARSAWEQRLKDLGELFLLTPVFPLLGAVVGYIFGVRQGTGTGQPAGDGVAPAGDDPAHPAARRPVIFSRSRPGR